MAARPLWKKIMEQQKNYLLDICMQNTPSLYIITPCRNASKTIKETILSVIAQPAIAPVYYHVQDGESSDGTQAILSEIEALILKEKERYPYLTFTWASEKDSGMYDAIAKGFAIFSIPQECFMGWINADDILCEKTVQTVQEVALSLPDVAWLGGPALVIDEKSTVISRGRAASLYPKELLAAGLCDGIHWKILQQEGIFWKKKIWDLAKGINTNLKLAGDWDLWRRMAQHADFVQLQKPTGAFRRHSGQLTEDISFYYKEMESILPQKARKASLTASLPTLSQSKTAQILLVQQNSLKLLYTSTPFTLYDKIWLIGVSLGLYSALRLCRKMLSALKRLS